MSEAARRRRWRNFRSWVEYAPENVYRHRTHGWEYVPVHPFGDEPEVLARLGMQPEECWKADAWWGIRGDATLLESLTVGASGKPAQLFAKPTWHEERYVYLVTVVDAPFVTRTAFEEAMVWFAEAGFPRAPQFQLRWGNAPPIVHRQEGSDEGDER